MTETTDDHDDEPNRDELDEETKELVEEIDELVDDGRGTENIESDGQPETVPSGSPSSGRYPRGSTPENHLPDGGSERTRQRSRSTSGEDESGGSGFITSVLTAPFTLILSKMPKRKSVYTKMIRSGYQGLYKNTSANVIVNCIYGDRYVVPRPAEVDDVEQKIRTDNGEEWSMPDGNQLYRIGDANIMWGVADAHELVTPVGARTAEKIDLGDAVYVQNKEQRRASLGPQASQTGQPQSALADGGHSGLLSKPLEAWDGEPFSDVLVNWANHNPDADGMVVSMEKHYELQHSQAGVEEMQKQEDRGRLAEAMNSETRTAMIYVGLLLLGLAIGLLGPGVAGSVGGGEGGTGISLFVMALGLI